MGVRGSRCREGRAFGIVDTTLVLTVLYALAARSNPARTGQRLLFYAAAQDGL